MQHRAKKAAPRMSPEAGWISGRVDRQFETAVIPKIALDIEHRSADPDHEDTGIQQIGWNVTATHKVPRRSRTMLLMVRWIVRVCRYKQNNPAITGQFNLHS